MNLTLIQTLEDRQNPDYIESNGPFYCAHKHAWLGHGYYFWDTHIELGHWWGETIYGENRYVVCTAKGKLDNTCWDLHGNGQHRIDFKNICEEMILQTYITKENLNVPKVIEFLKARGAFEKMGFKSIRAMGVNSLGVDNYIFRLPFVSYNKSYLDVFPPVQICLFNKKSLSLHDYKIIYPQEYASEIYG